MSTKNETRKEWVARQLAKAPEWDKTRLDRLAATVKAHRPAKAA